VRHIEDDLQFGIVVWGLDAVLTLQNKKIILLPLVVLRLQMEVIVFIHEGYL
jgi:hypothetical protein